MVAGYYVGIDVGTSGVRGALVDDNGTIVKTSVQDLTIYSPCTNHYEQSSDEIWRCCCNVIKHVTSEIAQDHVKGIGFDATCSLVVLDSNFDPVPVNKYGKDTNVIMWMDHRAGEQAEFINSTKHEVLQYVGGKISLEMQSPKLLWLKENLPNAWDAAAHFFDLPDFLTWKATGSQSRSMCSLVCKWTYHPTEGWNKDFWRKIGLHDLEQNNFEKIGSHVQQIGGSVHNGVSASASKETGLQIGTAVAVSIIDAHCGGIGTIGCSLENTEISDSCIHPSQRIALICGTSSCHMALSKDPIFVPGVWGPYRGVMIPEYWLNEGGQSSVANLLDHVVQSHPAYSLAQKSASEKGLHINNYLNQKLQEMSNEVQLEDLNFLTKNIHVWPDFHGNRSPLADPNMRGMIHGLTLDNSSDSLALLYLATLQGLAFGSKHILEEMTKAGHSFRAIFMTGGLQKNVLFVQTHANATGLPVVISKEENTVLLGGAILAASASGRETIESAMGKMCHVGKVIHPTPAVAKFYLKKYMVFRSMADHQKLCRDIMESE